MNLRIMKNGIETGRIENVNIQMKTPRDIYTSTLFRHEAHTPYAKHMDAWTVSVLYMLQYLPDDFTFEVY